MVTAVEIVAGEFAIVAAFALTAAKITCWAIERHYAPPSPKRQSSTKLKGKTP
jgi:hypothetical protein